MHWMAWRLPLDEEQIASMPASAVQAHGWWALHFTPNVAVLDEVRSAVERAWKGLCEQAIDRDGNLYGVCRGSGFSFSRAYYRTLMWNFNDTHGIGIVMLAGVEYLKLTMKAYGAVSL